MQRFRSSLLVLMVAVVALAQTASEKPSVDVRRVGARLQCQCGCKDSVATCSMVGRATSAQPSAKIKFAGAMNFRGAGEAACTSEDGLSKFTRNLSLMLSSHAKLSITLPQVALVHLWDKCCWTAIRRPSSELISLRP